MPRRRMYMPALAIFIFAAALFGVPTVLFCQDHFFVLAMALDVIAALALAGLFQLLVLNPLYSIEQYASSIGADDEKPFSAPKPPAPAALRGLHSSIEKTGELLAARTRELQVCQQQLHDVTNSRKTEEAKLSAAQVLYSSKFANDFIAMFNEDFRVTEANDRMLDFYGYSREELIGMHASQLRAPDTQADLVSQVTRVQESGSTRYETMHRRRDGKVFPVEVSLRAVDYQDKKFYQAVIVDITERKEAQRELQESEQKLKALFQQAPLGIAVIDARSGQFRKVNQQYCTITGYSEREMLDLTFQKITHPDDLQEDLDNMHRLWEGEVRRFQMDKRYLRKDGSLIWVRLTCVPLWDEPGTGRQHIAMVEDITGRKQSEAQLAESERKYRELVEYANSIILRWTRDGRINFLNEFGQRFFGYSAEEITGLHVMDTIVPSTDSDRRDMGKLMAEICAHPLSFEQNVNENMRRNGERVWIAWTNRVVHDEQGQVVEILSVGTDITKLKRAEAALYQSKELYRTLTESTVMGVWQSMPDGKTIYANPAMRALLEIEREEELSDKPFCSFFTPESVEVMEKEHQKHLHGVRSTCEAELIGLRGGRRSVVVSGASLPLSDEKQLSLIGTFMDITKRKYAETELQRLKNYLANIINSMPSMLVGLDPDGNVAQWSAQAEIASGVPAADAIGRPAADLLSEFSPWIQTLKKSLKENQPASLEKVLIPRNGQRRFFDLILYPLVTGGAEGAVLRIEDATERAGIQELMVQTEKMMSLGGLAAGMAHEINNPLGIITQAAQNIERRVSPEMPANQDTAERLGVRMDLVHRYFEERHIGQFIQDIREATVRAARIIANMLQFSRKSNVTKQNASLNDLLDRTVELAASDYDLKKNYDFRSIEIVKEYDPGLPEVPVVTVEIEQVLLNLLKNSGQALITNPPGKAAKITLRTEQRERYAIIEVEDNGPGMEENVRRRVFEPFFTTKEPGVGTGLGLSVSYTIITINHKGLISVDSAPGRGARFTIQLPIMPEESRGESQKDTHN